MTVEIKGTIVSPDYDNEFFAAWIDRGIITPSSRVVAAIESANEPIDIYVNTFGGDVFAGGEMYIAIIKAAMSGKIHKCEVGSLAASMGANIVASLASRGVTCFGYSNSQLMFHGCYTATVGGAQHHEDVARSLRNINEKVIADLNHLGVENCRAWFAEGRETWISADDLVEMKIFKGIADGFGEELTEMKQTAARLAAFARIIQSRTEYSMNVDETIKAEEVKPEEAAPVAEPAEAAPAVEEAKPEETDAPTEAVIQEAVEAAEENAEKSADDIEAKATALANQRFAGLQAKHEKMISELTNERDAAQKDLAAAKAVATSLQADIEKLEADLAACRDQLAKSEQNRESIVTRACSVHPEWPTLQEGLAKCTTPAEKSAFIASGKYRR